MESYLFRTSGGKVLLKNRFEVDVSEVMSMIGSVKVVNMRSISSRLLLVLLLLLLLLICGIS